MSLTVPSLRPEPPIRPFGPILRSRRFGRFSGRSVGGALGPRRPALQPGPCPLRVRQTRPPRPRPPPPPSPRSRAGGRSTSSPSQGAAVSPFASAASGISSVVPGGRVGGDVPIPHAALSHRPAWAACCAWLGTQENSRTPDSRPGPGCHGDASVDVVGGRPPGPSAAPGSVSQPPSWGPLSLLPVEMFDPRHFPAPRILCCLVSPEHSRPRRPVLGHPCRSPSVPSRDPSPPPWLYLLRGRIGPESPRLVQWFPAVLLCASLRLLPLPPQTFKAEFR